MPGVLAIGTQFQQGDGSSPENWTTIPGVRTIQQQAQQTVIKVITAHDSPNRTEERVGTLKQPGDWQFMVNYDPSNPSHQLLQSDWENFVIRHYRIVIPTPTPTKWMATAFVSDLSGQFPVDSVLEKTVKITNSIAIQTTGVP